MPLPSIAYTKLIPWLISLALAAASWFLWDQNQQLVAKGAECKAELERLTEDAEALRDRIALFSAQQQAIQQDLTVARQRLRQAQVPTTCEGAVQWLTEELAK
jgi:hypothetical protein